MECEKYVPYFIMRKSVQKGTSLQNVDYIISRSVNLQFRQNCLGIYILYNFIILIYIYTFTI